MTKVSQTRTLGAFPDGRPGRQWPVSLHLRPVPQRIGLLGGTFDPPHRGHTAAAVSVRDALGLDRVILMVANQPWQKSASRHVTPAEIRLAMVREAVRGIDGLEAGDAEIRRGGVTYTSDTLEELRRADDEAEFFVIVGADTAATFDTWHRYTTIADQSTLVAITRPGHMLRGVADVQWTTVDVVPVDVTSTEIRRRVASGESIIDDVSPGVARIIDEQGLYRDHDVTVGEFTESVEVRP